MDDNRKQRQPKWGSVVGWLIFFLVVAGGPILSALQGLLQSASGGALRLPSGLLPLLILGLVVLSAVISVIGALAGRGDQRARTPGPGPANVPPMMRGSPGMPSLPPPSRAPLPVSRSSDRLPSPPRFEPIFSPLVATLGVIGLLVFGGAAILLFAGVLP